MVRIRPSGTTGGDPETVAGRPLAGDAVPPPDDELDDLAGVEAFAPRDDGDFGRAFARRRREPGAGDRLARAGLAAAVLVGVLGLLAVAFGLADDDGGDDLATTATSTTARAVSTTTSPSTTSTARPATSTTSGFAPGTTAATVGRTTITTTRPTTTLPEASTTTVLSNRPMRIEISLDRAPLAGQAVLVTVFAVDPDAVPTDRCQVVTINGSTIIEDPCEPEDCPPDPPPVADNGGDRTLRFDHTFTTAGEYTIEVTARSGLPECGNPYADVATGSLTVTVT